jgi:hypothetical protein
MSWSVCPLWGETTLRASYLSVPWQIYETMYLLLRVQGSQCSPWGMGYWLTHLSLRFPDPTSFLEKCLFQLLPNCSWIIFLLFNCRNSLYILDSNTSYIRYMICKHFLTLHMLFFHSGLCFFFCGTGVWTQRLTLARATHSALFCFSYFSDRFSLLPGLSLELQSSYLCLSSSLDYRQVSLSFIYFYYFF